MASDILSELFSDARVKVMRLFLRNPQTIFGASEISERTHVELAVVRAEARLLQKIGFLQEGASGQGRPKAAVTINVKGWSLNSHFELLRPLRTLLMKEVPVTNAALFKRFSTFGNRLKLVVLTGIFLDEADARVDALFVGEGISRSRLQKTVESIEADFGRELSYVYFTMEEYEYRIKMYDHFLRDILALPHETLIDRLEVKKA